MLSSLSQRVHAPFFEQALAHCCRHPCLLRATRSSISTNSLKALLSQVGSHDGVGKLDERSERSNDGGC